jgi:hypothetical protein
MLIPQSSTDSIPFSANASHRTISCFSALCDLLLHPSFPFVSPSTQMFAIALFIFSLSLIGMFYPYNRGALLSACVLLYALTAGIAGGV